MSEHSVTAPTGKRLISGELRARGAPAERQQGSDHREILFIEPPRAKQECLDLLVLNPPAPNSASSRRASHSEAARPQTALAQLGAVIQEAGYRVDVVDAHGMGMTWEQLEQYMWRFRPRYTIIHAAAATLTNDMRATFLGKAAGTITIAIGAHVTALSRETLETYPSLDVVVRGEPELTALEVMRAIDRQVERERADAPAPVGGLELVSPSRARPFPDASYLATGGRQRAVPPALIARALRETRGVAFRDEHGVVSITPDRPLIENLDSLPLPLHHLLPWRKYRVPIVGRPYTFVLTSRGCPGGCRYCIKHVTYQSTVRHRSAEHVLRELHLLKQIGVHHIHFEADLFTVNRAFVYDLCRMILSEGLDLRWSCNSRVDFVDEELLLLMRRAGCFLIGWGLESGSEEVLRRARKGTTVALMQEMLAASRRVGIKNWGYFMIGLPGETVETIRQTIDLSKRLPLDIALFHIATPYPGTPLYYEAVENGWIRMERWEDFDMCRSAALSYPHLSASDLEYWVRRAAREWSLRPAPLLRLLRAAAKRETLRHLWRSGSDHTRWMVGGLAPIS